MITIKTCILIILFMNSILAKKDPSNYLKENEKSLSKQLEETIEGAIKADPEGVEKFNEYSSKVREDSGIVSYFEGVTEENLGPFLDYFLKFFSEDKREKIAEAIKSVKSKALPPQEEEPKADEDTSNWTEIGYLFKDSSNNKVGYTKAIVEYKNQEYNFIFSSATSGIEIKNKKDDLLILDKGEGKEKETTVIAKPEEFTENDLCLIKSLLQQTTLTGLLNRFKN